MNVFPSHLQTSDFNDTFNEEPESEAVPSGTLILTLGCIPPDSYPPAIVTWFKYVRTQH